MEEYPSVLDTPEFKLIRIAIHAARIYYDKDTFDKRFKGNICVGLTGYETKLILKKMKQLGWYSK